MPPSQHPSPGGDRDRTFSPGLARDLVLVVPVATHGTRDPTVIMALVQLTILTGPVEMNSS